MAGSWTTPDFDRLISELKPPDFWKPTCTVTYQLLDELVQHIEQECYGNCGETLTKCLEALKPHININETMPTYSNIRAKLKGKKLQLSHEVPWTVERTRVTAQQMLGPHCAKYGIGITVNKEGQECVRVPLPLQHITNGVVLELRRHWWRKRYQWKVLFRWLSELGWVGFKNEKVLKDVNGLQEKYTALTRQHKVKALEELCELPFWSLQTVAQRQHHNEEKINEDSHGKGSADDISAIPLYCDAACSPVQRSEIDLRQLESMATIRKLRKNSKRREERREKKIWEQQKSIKMLSARVTLLKHSLNAAKAAKRRELRARNRERSKCNRLQKEVKSLNQKLKEMTYQQGYKEHYLQIVQDELKDAKDDKFQVTTKDGNIFTNGIRQTIMALGSLGISIANIPRTMEIVALSLFGVHLPVLPSEATVRRILGEGNLVAKQQLANVLLSERNTTLHADGTTDHQVHHLGFQLATETSSFCLGLRETVSSGSNSQLEELDSIMTEFVRLICPDQTGAESLKMEMFMSIKNLMTDQHVVNIKFKKDFEDFRMKLLEMSESLFPVLSDSERQETVKLHQWFCFLHVLLGFADCTQTAMQEYEDIATDGGKLPLGRKNCIVEGRQCGAVLETVRAVCALVTPSGHPAAGIPQDFRAWMSQHGYKMHLIKNAHNRFNVIFHNAAAVFHHHHHIKAFLSEITSLSNQLIESVKSDLEDEVIMACLRGLGIFYVVVTAPFHTMILSPKTTHILDLNPFLVKLRSTLEELSSNPWVVLQPNYCVLVGMQPVHDDIHSSVMPKSEEETYLDISMEVLGLVATHCLVCFTRQVASQLPGGEHASVSENIRLQSKTVHTSNSLGESQFALLKQLRSLKPNANIESLEASVMWAYNKTLDWLQALTGDQREAILSSARNSYQEFRNNWMRRREDLRRQRLEILKNKENLKAIRATKQATVRQKTVDEVISNGGQCRSSEDVDSLINKFQEDKEVIKALKAQLKYYKDILPIYAIDKKLFQFSRRGKIYTCSELASNLKEIIRQYNVFIAAVPSTSSAEKTIVTPAIREERIKEAKKAVLCNYVSMSEEANTSKCKRGVKRKAAFPSDIVGKRIRHRWQVGKCKRWFNGRVIRICGPDAQPTEKEDADDNPATQSIYKLFQVKYDGDDELYHLRIEKDWYRGDIDVLDE